MSFSDDSQEYLIVRPPQSVKPGAHTSHNLQVQRLLSSTAANITRPRIVPIVNLEAHSVRKTRVRDAESGSKLYKFEREPKGVLGKWQVDPRRGNGGGWIFVGKYERYEWARTRGTNGQSWSLVRSTYSHTKTMSSGSADRRSNAFSDRTVRPSMDDTSPERRLVAKITLTPPSPPSFNIIPRNSRGSGFADVEAINKEEIMDALVQGLWIVWREGVVNETDPGKRNSWTPVIQKKRKKTLWERVLCR
jgi:hypothetical protein